MDTRQPVASPIIGLMPEVRETGYFGKVQFASRLMPVVPAGICGCMPAVWTAAPKQLLTASHKTFPYSQIPLNRSKVCFNTCNAKLFNELSMKTDDITSFDDAVHCRILTRHSVSGRSHILVLGDQTVVSGVITRLSHCFWQGLVSRFTRIKIKFFYRTIPDVRVKGLAGGGGCQLS